MLPILDDHEALLQGNGITETETVFNPNQIEIASGYIGTDIQPDVPKNVSGGKYEPFTRIEIKKLMNSDGYSSHHRNIRVERDTGELMEAGVVGPNYLLVTNQQVNDVCSDIRTQTGMAWEQDKLFFDGKRYRNVYRTEQVSVELEVGDMAYLMMTELNSYDGSQTAGFRIDYMIKICLNGMNSPKYGWNSLFRHSMGNVDWPSQIQAGAMALTGTMAQTKLNTFAKACNRLQKPLDIDKLGEIRGQAIPKLPPLRFGQILDKYYTDKGTSQWDFMQAGTSTLWHRDKMTSADFKNNGVFVDGLLEYGKSQDIA